MVTLKTLPDLTIAERTPKVLKHQKGAFLTLGGVGHGLIGSAAILGSAKSIPLVTSNVTSAFAPNKKPPAEARGLSASVGPCPMPTTRSAMRGSELEGWG